MGRTFLFYVGGGMAATLIASLTCMLTGEPPLSAFESVVFGLMGGTALLVYDIHAAEFE